MFDVHQQPEGCDRRAGDRRRRGQARGRGLPAVGEHSRPDLVLDIAGRLLRVQCKWGRLGLDGDVVIARIGGSSCSPSGYVLTSYREGEVDLFGIYCGELDRAFLMPASLCVERQEIRRRLTPARNSQRACINLADQYDFAGAIAQLGERSAGSRKVGGSSPPSSTPPSVDLPAEVGVNRFRDQLSYWMDQAAVGAQLTVTRRGRPLVRLGPA